jgi:hypothetical protein
VAVQASSEIVIDAPPEVIMEALADMDAVPSWSSVHKRIEVVDKHPDGRPHLVKVTIAVTGIHDTELLEYHWGPDWMVWDAHKTSQQHGQHGEYNLDQPGPQKDPSFRARGSAKAGDGARGLRPGYLAPRRAASRLIPSSRVSSRLQKVKRTK